MQKIYLITLLISIYIAKTSQFVHPPTIGILTQNARTSSRYQLISACYIRFIESVGALAVPIDITQSRHRIIHTLNKINGVLIPGGGAKLFINNNKNRWSRFGQVSKIVLDYSVAQWKKKVTFPIWGTCLGFQALLMTQGRLHHSKQLLTRIGNKNISENIIFNKHKKSVFTQMPKRLKHYATNKKPFFYWNDFAVLLDTFKKNKRLNKMFEITAKTKGRNGQLFVAGIQGKHGLPVYGSQFHPEKVFNWLPTRDINHDPRSFELNQYFAKFFINQAVKNDHSFKSYYGLKLNVVYKKKSYIEICSDQCMEKYLFKNNRKRRQFFGKTISHRHRNMKRTRKNQHRHHRHRSFLGLSEQQSK